jgi:cytochrome P450/NADPH-cytochrome P450 reductase
MGTLLLTKKETTFFTVVFSVLLFVCNISDSYVLLCILLLVAPITVVLFIQKKKEVYFMWSLVSPRITGVGPLIEYILAFAKEEGPGNGELNDLLRIDIPFQKPMFFIFKPAYLNRILSAEAENFRTRGYEGAVTQMAMGPKNIFTSEGPPNPHWKLYREVVSEMNQDRLTENSIMAKLFASTWKATQELTHIFDDKRGQTLDLFYHLHHVLVPTLHHAIFGEETARKYSYKELPHEVYEVLAEIGPRFTCGYTPSARDKIFKSQTKRISDAVRNMGGDSNSPVVSLLQGAHKKGLLNDEELQSNLLIFAYAHAPLNAVFWALYALALHPEDTKKVVNEIATVLSKGPLTYDRLGEFKFLNKVVAETLRLYPSVGLMQVRYSQKNTMLGEHFVPEGSFMFISHYIVHRNAKFWKDPDDFNPMREGLDTLLGDSLNLLPFGYGPRVCAGRYFAQDFVKVSLISLLQHHQIDLAPGQKGGQPTSVVFLSPGRPLYFIFSKRELPPVVVEPVPSSPIIAKQQSFVQIVKRVAPPKFKSIVYKLMSQNNIFKEALISTGKADVTEEAHLLILYGSQSGHARALATRILHMANMCKMNAVVVSLSELDTSTITKYKYVVISTSTFGDGGPPENGEAFNAWLARQSSATLFNGIQFAVLSLGSSMYANPFKFGWYVSQRFAALGAKSIMPTKSIDEIRYNQEEEFKNWSVQLFDIISQDKEETKNLMSRNKMLGFQNFDFNLMNAPAKISFTKKLLKRESRLNYGTNTIISQVLNNTLVSRDPLNRMYCMELKLVVTDGDQQMLSYEAGDSVSVLPMNNTSIVEKLLTRLGVDGNVVFNIESEQNQVDLYCSLGKNKCTPFIAFSFYYDITSTPTVAMLKFLAMHTTDTEHGEVLTSYANRYRSFLLLEYSLLDVLELFPSVQIFRPNSPKEDEEAFAVFLGLLGPVKARYYSIASAPGSDSNMLRLVYKVVEYKTKSGVNRQGLCSTFLHSRKPNDDVAISISRSSKFKLPLSEASFQPIIMIGAGSGISPYFSFLEQRLYHKNTGSTLGRAILVHGCRSEVDFVMKEKVEEALASNLLTELWPAYSQKVGEKPMHIQDVILEKGEVLWDLLQNQNAILYICGDINIGTSVREAFIALAKKIGLDHNKAQAWLMNLRSAGRLRHDEWGISTNSGQNLIRAARLKLWRKSITATLAFSNVKKIVELRDKPSVPIVAV